MSEKEPVLFVKTAVRKYINESDCNASADIINGNVLNNQIKIMLDLAIERAKKKGLKTIKGIHFRGLVIEDGTTKKKKKR